MKKRYLILESGRVFEGVGFGADPSPDGTVGELVFTTGMCGYLECITDPSYYGQIVTQTFPMIGNYGVISSDFEGRPALFGYVVREWCPAPSNFRSEGDIDSFLKDRGIPGICGVDTREITKLIRDRGVMNAVITDGEPDFSLYSQALSSYKVRGAVPAVTSTRPNLFPAEGDEKFRVVLIDYGAKAGITAALRARGCSVLSVPANTDAESILEMKPDGVMLSNGPGDPTERRDCIEELKKIFGRVPIFGICLGHQLLALSTGALTEKLKFGHRGANQPVRDVKSGRTYITSQNHGYAVRVGSLRRGTMSFTNANDGTCEGIDYEDDRAFSVQFHPEARSGPHDTAFLFDRFVRMMEVRRNAKG